LERARSSDLFLNLGHTLDHLFLLIYPTVVLALSPEFGRPYSELLPLALGGFIAFGAGSLPAGWLADRWSRRGMMIVFFIGIGAASILTGFAQSTWQIAAALTLLGLFGAIYHPVGIAMLVSGRDKIGKVLGVNGVYGNLGVAFAALIAGAFAHWISWRAAFIVPGVVSIAVGIAFAATVPDQPAAAQTATRTARAGFSRGLLVRVFAVLTVTTLFGGVIFNSTTVAMPKIFDERLTELVNTTLGIGILVCFVYCFAAVAQLVVGHFLDRGALKSVLVPVLGLQVPLLLAAAFFDQHLLLVVALAMMFFVFGQIPINDAMVATYTDEAWRSRVYAVRYVVSFGASACALPLVAFAHRYSSDFKYLFFVLAGMAALMLSAAVFLPSEVRRPAPA
jgi:MFS family permease